MVFSLTSVEWLRGVEPFEVNEGKKEESNENEDVSPIETNDEAVALLLEWKVRLSADSDRCTTCDCSIDFSDREAVLEHYRSEWHKSNVKRKTKNLETLNEEDFENGGDEPVTNTVQDYSSEDSDDEEFETCYLPAGRAFFVQNGQVFSVPKNILHCNESSVNSAIFSRPFDCAIFLWTGGHFAAGLFENGRLVGHKSFHRYVARAKQGGVQSQFDKQGKAANSAGAALRRHNEQQMKEDITQLLSSWKDKLKSIPLVFIRSAAYQKGVFLDAGCGISRGDPRIRTIPFETKRASSEEVKSVFEKLQLVSQHGSVEEYRKELELIKEKRQRLTQKVDKKRKKGQEKIGDWDELSEKQRSQNDSKEPKKTDHVKVRQETKTDDRWPNLDEKWRKVTFNTIRLDDVDGLKSHITTINEEYKEEVNDYLRNARFGASFSTFLHICAAKSLKSSLNFLLTDISCDPSSKDESGRPPYSLSADRLVRDVFIGYRRMNPDKHTWSRTHIPEPAVEVVLTEEAAMKKAAKKAEKRQKDKEKMKAKKEIELKELEEQKEKEKWINMPERERRAIAVERRLAGLPPISRCQQCGTQITGTPFIYNHFNFCSTKCVNIQRDQDVKKK